MINFYPATDIARNDEHYDNMYKLIEAFLETEKDWLAQMCNTIAMLNYLIKEISWIGFYLLKNNELILGPFQGKMAPSRISLEKGSCGFAATQLKTIRIDNVNKFEGYIQSDNSAFSEIVIPLFFQNKQKEFNNLIGVLTINSQVFARFNDADEKGLEKVAELIANKIAWPSGNS